MKQFKTAVSRMMLFFLGRGVKAGYQLDSRVKAEINSLGESFSVRLKSAPENAPSMTFFLKDGTVKTLTGKKSEQTKPDLGIEFKNIESGFLVLTGQSGIGRSFAEHRMLVFGDIYTAMSVVRLMAILENYLFPSFMTKKILLRRPEKEVSSIRFYLKVLLNL